MAVKPIPDGYSVVTPYLVLERAPECIDFMKKAFDAAETFRMDGPDGTIGHAELTIGDSRVMVGSAGPENPPMPAMLHLFVEDCDEVFKRALDAGATKVRELQDQFYGDRSGGVRDPSGNLWWITTHIEDVAPEEMERRAKELGESQST